MKIATKLLTLALALGMVVSMAACSSTETTTDGSEAAVSGVSASAAESTLPEITEVKDAAFDAFLFQVNGVAVDNAAMETYPVYSISVSTTNSKGEVSESTYTGYAVKDVLKAAGVESAATVAATASDGYTVDAYAITEENAAYTLVAIQQNGEAGEDNTVWFAPCMETLGNVYAKLVTDLTAE